MVHLTARYHWLGIVVGLAAFSVLMGWWLDVAPLTTMLPGWPSMKPNTALAFLLTGASLWCLRCANSPEDESGWCQAGLACSLLVAGIGVLTLGEYAADLNLGIDQLLWRDALRPGEVAIPGRMAPATALGFALTGTALVLFHLGRGWAVGQALLAVVAALFALPLLSDLYAGPVIRTHHFFSSVALHTALLFLLVATAALAARADRGFMATAWGAGLGAQAIRRLLPASLALLVVLGWLEGLGRRAGLYPAELGTAILVLASLVFLGLMIWRVAVRLNAMERALRDRERLQSLLARERNAELAASQRRFSDQFEYAPDAIFIVRADGVIAMANRQTENLFGYRREELVGQTVEILLPESMRERHIAHRAHFHREHSARGMGAGLSELPARRKDGTTFPAEISLSPFTSHDGAQMVVATVRDISERVRSTKALEQANATIEAERARLAERVEARTAELSQANLALKEAVRARENFLATMSHEIRTPLNGLLGMLELISLTPLTPPQRSELEIAVSSGRSLGRIIDDILDYSKMEAGKLDIHPQPDSLARVVEGVRNAYLGSASGKALTLTCDLDPRIRPALNLDALRLSQVLNNFVSNAIKFTQTGGIVIRAGLVEQTEAADTVRISVTDTGTGIAPEAQARLFRPYAQAHAGIERLHGGTGLGLAICWRLTEMMGGEIALDSAPGEGTTLSVTLTFPAADETSLPRAEAPVLDLTPLASNGLPILVVDDHPTNRTLAARQLGSLGLTAELAEDGAMALERWRKGNYALVITDVHMPEMDGYALTAAIREYEAREGRPRTPIIAWTAKAFAEDLERSREAGMDDYLVKPTELSALRQALVRWLPAVAKSGEGDSVAIGTAELALLSGCPEEQAEILCDFVLQTEMDLEDLKSALAQDDLAGAGRIAHRMKGASRMVGARDLAGHCETLEQEARSGNRERLPPLLGDVERAVRELATHLEKSGCAAQESVSSAAH